MPRDGEEGKRKCVRACSTGSVKLGGVVLCVVLENEKATTKSNNLVEN